MQWKKNMCVIQLFRFSISLFHLFFVYFFLVNERERASWHDARVASEILHIEHKQATFPSELWLSQRGYTHHMMFDVVPCMSSPCIFRGCEMRRVWCVMKLNLSHCLYRSYRNVSNVYIPYIYGIFMRIHKILELVFRLPSAPFR